MKLGVDLGTTNTVVAREAKALTLGSEASSVIPSVVAHHPNGRTLVGSRAKNRRAVDPVNTIYSSKRLIGRRWSAAETRDFDNRYPFELAEQDEIPVFVTRAGKFSPQQIGAEIARAAFEAIEGLVIADGEVVVAVPAAFGDAQRQATVEALELAGAADPSLIDEPVATTRAFSTMGLIPAGPVAVYDLGGGTFELAIVAGGDGANVVGTASDLYLGGDDIDRALADSVADQVLAANRWDLRDDPIVYDRLVLAAEEAKRALSTEISAQISLTEVDPALPGEPSPLVITREKLGEVARPIVRRTFLLCDQAIADAGIAVSDLSAILLAGGSSQLSIVGEMVSQYFGAAPVCVTNPMEVVAIGASIA